MPVQEPRYLSDDDRIALLRIARTAIECATAGRKFPNSAQTLAKVMLEKRGAFVSLHVNDELRGCIGYVTAVKPLWQTIMEMAEAAAMRDPRFRPVHCEEMEKLEIQISVLSPMRLISDYEEIVIGEHGLLIEKEYNNGLLLPQVATEYNWDRIAFLEHTCFKAGLPKSAWKDPGTKIFIFSAEIFSEKDNFTGKSI
jgi:AmmeMemoRadiSam system protein A